MRSDLSILRGHGRIAALALGLMLTVPPQANALGTVFDPFNYSQNILTAARSLTQINQQIDQLRNETQMLLRMEIDLKPLNQTVSPEITRTLGQIKTLMDEAEGIAMTVLETDQAMKKLFPDAFAISRSGEDVVRDATERWQETLAAYKRSASLQAQISQNLETDAALMTTLLARSGAAAGNLQAAQAGNELAGLSIKQSLQLQQLMAAQYRAESFERSRRLASERDGRARFRGFLGSSTGTYTPDG